MSLMRFAGADDNGGRVWIDPLEVACTEEKHQRNSAGGYQWFTVITMKSGYQVTVIDDGIGRGIDAILQTSKILEKKGSAS